MTTKMTMLFNFQGSGFSETWYSAADFSVPLLAGNPFDELYNVRSQLTNTIVIPQGYRLSKVGSPRTTYTYVDNRPAPIKGGGTVVTAPDTVTNSWLAIARGLGGRARRQVWLRGIPDDWIVWNNAAQGFSVQGAMQAPYRNFVTLIKNGTWKLRYVKSLVEAAGGNPIPNVQPGLIGNTTKLIAAAAGLVEGTPIVVSGFKKPLGYLNGTYVGYSGWGVGGGDVILQNKGVSTLLAAGYPGGARVRSAAYDYTSIIDVQLEFARERRVGRAFFVPVGRRPVRR